jgi:hypothetical protein
MHFWFVQVHHGPKSCTSLLENASLRDPSGSVRVSPASSVCPSSKQVLLLGAPEIPTCLQSERFL